jgi:hypothetical protein
MGAAGVAAELAVDKADALDDTLGRVGESARGRSGTVGIGWTVGVRPLASGVGGVNERSRGAGEGEGGGVGRLRLSEVGTAEPEACLVFLEMRSGLEVV